ncbi:DUF1648 domain-containing protein [Oceanobacillus massiliensis]|uniref:DUF1648 domain-containing protein n=1 Tax=Oceanobacillus massiliensis TaxID=1465765 RepID=UPI000287C113|nr:DUF5808 domain-containing protein [Oceanobacillus massiliensis]
MNDMLIIFVFLLIPGFISMIFIPYWTRKTESFGVSIPEDVYNRQDLKTMRKQYSMLTGILGLLITVIFLMISSILTNSESVISILFSVTIFVFLVGSFLIYLKFHSDMKKLKEKENWAKEKSQQIFIDTKFRNQKLTHSNLWFLLSFLISIATIVITLQAYQDIPQRIPMQYNFEGEVTNWEEKSYRTLLINPIMQMYLTLLFLFINKMIGYAKQQIDPENPQDSIRRNVIFRKRWSAYIILSGLALTLMFSLIQLSFIFPINQQFLTLIPLLITIGLIGGAIGLSMTTGQGGSRVKSTGGISGNVINQDDDKHWKLGQFYVNKDDPSLFLEKRFGVGWTINFARPLAWIILLTIIGLAVGIPLLLGL